MENKNVFPILRAASDLLIASAANLHIRLKAVEYVVPFIDDDKHISIWLFYEKTEDIDDYNSSGITRSLEKLFIELCVANALPVEYIHTFSFVVDSEENVIENFSGSYFYRLRG